VQSCAPGPVGRVSAEYLFRESTQDRLDLLLHEDECLPQPLAVQRKLRQTSLAEYKRRLLSRGGPAFQKGSYQSFRKRNNKSAGVEIEKSKLWLAVGGRPATFEPRHGSAPQLQVRSLGGALPSSLDLPSKGCKLYGSGSSYGLRLPHSIATKSDSVDALRPLPSGSEVTLQSSLPPPATPSTAAPLPAGDRVTSATESCAESPASHAQPDPMVLDEFSSLVRGWTPAADTNRTPYLSPAPATILIGEQLSEELPYAGSSWPHPSGHIFAMQQMKQESKTQDSGVFASCTPSQVENPSAELKVVSLSSAALSNCSL